MGNRENTAINELVARASGGPSSASPQGSRAVEVSVEPPLAPPGEGAGAARTPGQRLGALHDRDPMHTTYPASMPVAAPFEPQRAGLPTSYPVVPRAMLGDLAPVASAPVAPAAAVPAAAVPAPAARVPTAPAPGALEGDPADAQSWRASSSPQDWLDADAATIVEPPGEHLVGTLQLHRPSEVRAVVGRLVLPIAILIVAGVLIGGYFAIAGSSAGSRAPTVASRAAEPAAAPAATPAPVAAEAAPARSLPPARARELAPASPPALVDVRIDSTPSGATVMLADRGKNQFVGTTPVSVALDPSRDYDVVFSYADRAHIEHLDPRTTRRLVAALGKRAPPDSAPRGGEKPVAPAAAAARPERAAEGTLMISSKPPCEIMIDGKPTGLMTPQRSIALSPGIHRVTLVNGEQDIRKTVNVQITANATEKVIEDLMK